MTLATDLADIRAFLPCPTPPAWLHWALANPELLLVDHANCEKKAASTAVNLIYRYVEHADLLLRLSKLAREELRHFEQVVAIMHERGVAYSQIAASRYAGELRKAVRTHEPERLVDTLLVGSIIEARHFKDYLRLAEAIGSPQSVAERLPALLAREQVLIESPDTEFRFHSGPPAELQGYSA